MSDFNFKKKWGQNFLRNVDMVLTLLTAADLQKEDRILEIGPGDGAVTEFVIENVDFTLAVDIDPEAVNKLKEKFGHYESFEIKNISIMDVRLNELTSGYKINKIIGSLPYNLSKKIISKFCEYPDNVFESCTFIIQKEVAHSYAGIGKKGTFLNNLFQVSNNIELIADIEKSNFFPVPQVDGSIIKFTPRKKLKIKPSEYASYKKFLRNSFRNPRKKLKKNLRSIYKNYNWDDIFNSLDFKETTRVEELSNDEIIKLFELFNKISAKNKNN